MLQRLRNVIFSTFLVVGFSHTVAGISSKDHLIATACIRNPTLAFCDSNSNSDSEPARPSVSHHDRTTRPDSGRSNRVVENRDFVEQSGPLPRRHRPSFHGPSRRSHHRHHEDDGPLSNIHDKEQLRELCTRFYPLAVQHCGRQQLTKNFVDKCAGYFRDCQPYIPQGDPLQAISDSFSSSVALNLGSWDVKGLPFYPINEEGGIGSGYYVDIPFGAWGGGYAQNIGVRDYWSQTFEVGANWIDGKYGYRTGWSVPLVQSLGVEGGGGTDVSVPLTADKIGTVDVDNHYGVGGYYKHNQHTGVDWRRGEVKSMFGVGVPFAGVGVNTGVGVAFPSLDAWQSAVGR
uniref:Secreted protein n=1 Tax=Panagrellus redivivus TaxID=6233 RepID=A0A7E4WDQ4_PANRE